MSRPSLHRHILGGIALTNGLLLHSEDAAVLAVRLANGQIVTKYWKLPQSAVYPWLRWWGVRGIGILVRTVLWNSRIRAFLLVNAPVLEGQTKRQSKYRLPSPLFPLSGLLVALIVYLEVILLVETYWAYLSADFSIVESNVVTISLTAMLIIWMLERTGVWQYMAYHGSMHQAIHAFEMGDHSSEAVQRAWPYQARCGAAVVSYVAIALVIIGYLWPSINFLWSVVISVLLFSLSYELVLVLDRNREHFPAEFFSLPGVLLQLLIARHPNKHHSAVAYRCLDQIIRHSRMLNKQIAASPLD